MGPRVTWGQGRGWEWLLGGTGTGTRVMVALGWRKDRRLGGWWLLGDMGTGELGASWPRGCGDPWVGIGGAVALGWQ